MSDPLRTFTGPSGEELVARLATHRTLAGAPRGELEWLAAHGTMEHWATGYMPARKGERIDSLYVILVGRLSHLTEQAGTWRKVIEWQGGDVSGQLPYSRMVASPGNTVTEEPIDMLRVPTKDFEEMITACPHVTAALVHVMVDRARTFKTSDLQQEKMASLGKLAAGLAHELNNPSSAAAGSARLASEALEEADAAARALGTAQFDADTLSLIERVRASGLATPTTRVLSPVERADREEEIGDWLEAHGSDESFAESLTETNVTLAMLDELATALDGEKLDVALRWLAAGCRLRGLVRDIERAASRVHALVSAIKGITHMDQAAAPEAVDLAKGLTDTLAVLGAKARGRSASLNIDMPADLPHACGFSGELNQVWVNLIDNALDAIHDGGHVNVSARASNGTIVVRITDDGPGIPDDVKRRIFDPFFTTKPVGKGTGLGLDIVRRLVENNNGRVDVYSEPGNTEFRVTLPVMK